MNCLLLPPFAMQKKHYPSIGTVSCTKAASSAASGPIDFPSALTAAQVPRTINCLNAFRAALPASVTSGLTTQPSRTPSSANIEATRERGRALWTSIYRPFETKLVDKLAQAHPDLPVHLVNSEYGLLFSDPPREAPPGQKVGRIAMSCVAVACCARSRASARR